MTVVFDMHDGLARALRGRAEAWDFLRAFAAHWTRPLEPGDGWSAEAVAGAERRLGVALPAALREAYVLFGRRTDLTSNHDTLLGPDELYVSDGALVYRVENQGCAFWGVALEDLERADPGTLIRPDLADKSQERWEPWEPSLSAACVSMVMSETVLRDDGLTDHGEVAEGELDLVGILRRLPDIGPELRWFSGPDVLVREVEGGFLDVRARTEEALDAVREAIPADWLNG
ncbi:SMI1/KNR4 family protein [Streptomyces sp. NPDC002888]|uniref:SMI1/KNR4 family protein n=1 Tax=Streptomyces sp. NPDC002888 TaxID=3364668 RepID=UPI0036BE9DE4